MKCYLQGHRFHYEMENLARLFFPCEKIEMKYALPQIGRASCRERV